MKQILSLLISLSSMVAMAQPCCSFNSTFPSNPPNIPCSTSGGYTISAPGFTTTSPCTATLSYQVSGAGYVAAGSGSTIALPVLSPGSHTIHFKLTCSDGTVITSAYVYTFNVLPASTSLTANVCDAPSGDIHKGCVKNFSIVDGSSVCPNDNSISFPNMCGTTFQFLIYRSTTAPSIGAYPLSTAISGLTMYPSGPGTCSPAIPANTWLRIPSNPFLPNVINLRDAPMPSTLPVNTVANEKYYVICYINNPCCYISGYATVCTPFQILSPTVSPTATTAVVCSPMLPIAYPQTDYHQCCEKKFILRPSLGSTSVISGTGFHYHWIILKSPTGTNSNPLCMAEVTDSLIISDCPGTALTDNTWYKFGNSNNTEMAPSLPSLSPGYFYIVSCYIEIPCNPNLSNFASPQIFKVLDPGAPVPSITWADDSYLLSTSVTSSTGIATVTRCTPPAASISLGVSGLSVGSTAYEWYDNFNGSGIDGAFANFPVTAAATHSVYVYTTTTDINTYPSPGCRVKSEIIKVIINTSTGLSTVSIAANPGNTVCAGTSVTFTATPTNGGTTPTYHWYVDGGNVGANSPTYTTTSLTDGQIITCVMTSNATCVSGSPATSNTIVMTVTPSPAMPGNISGITTVCSGSTQTYSISAVTGATSYTWTKPSGWSGASTTTSLTTTATTTSGSITVTANNSCGASAPKTLAVTVLAIPSMPGNISGSTTVCSGISQTYSISAVTGATSYTWTKPSGWSGTSTTASLSTTTTTSGSITVTANNSCGSSAPKTLAIAVLAIPSMPGNISGTTTVCGGSTQTYSISAVSGATSYTWTKPSGWSGTSTTTSLTTTTTATSGSITVTANNSCGSSAPKTLAITVQIAVPPMPGNISGNTTICSGSTQTYSVSAVTGATSYTWTKPSGWSGTSTTPSLTTTATTTSGSITVTANNSCGSSAPKTLAITVQAAIPSMPGNISGSTTVCFGTTQTYSISAVAGATSYTWTKPSGWSGTSTTNSLTTNAALSSGNITVTANNSCGASAPRTVAVTVCNCANFTITVTHISCNNGTLSNGDIIYTITFDVNNQTGCPGILGLTLNTSAPLQPTSHLMANFSTLLTPGLNLNNTIQFFEKGSDGYQYWFMLLMTFNGQYIGGFSVNNLSPTTCPR